MKRSKFISTLSLGVFISLACANAHAQGSLYPPTDADSSAANMHDSRMTQQPMADQAANTPSDRQIMSRIRKGIVRDPSLSTNAHNVKVIAQNGHVTLKGLVDNMAERKKIDSKAFHVVGAENVTDALIIKGFHN